MQSCQRTVLTAGRFVKGTQAEKSITFPVGERRMSQREQYRKRHTKRQKESAPESDGDNNSDQIAEERTN